MFPTRLLAYSFAAVLALFVGHGLAQPKKPADPKPYSPEVTWMEEKRTRTHAVLDALTAGDNAALRREAEGLVRVAERPIFLTGGGADEPRFKTEEYQYQAKAFKHAADDLLAAAKAKNTDAAALAYFDMTRTCVRCHAHFRGVAPKKD